MNMELPIFKGLQRRKIKGEGGAQNMRFCETNRIRHDAIGDVTRCAEGGYERAAQKMNPVRLERNDTRWRHYDGNVLRMFPSERRLQESRQKCRSHENGGDIAGWGVYRMAL